MPQQSFGPDLKPDSADYVVYAIARLEEQLKAQERASQERAADNKQRFDDFLLAAQQRGKLYEHRDHEWTTQIEKMGVQITKLTEIAMKLSAIDDDVKDLTQEVHQLHQRDADIDRRLQDVERCKSKVEEHLLVTAPDHLVLSNTRARLKAIGWIGATLVFIATTIGGLIPLVEKLWPSR